MNRGFTSIAFLAVLIAVVLIGGGAYFVMNGSVPAMPETPTTEEQAIVQEQEVEKDTKQIVQVAPKNTNSAPTTPIVEEKKPADTTPPYSLQPFFLKSRTDLMHPSKTDWIAIGANGPDNSIDLDGWRVRSTVYGYTFVIRTIVSVTGPTIPIRLGSPDVAVFVHTVGAPTQNYSAGGEYHLYFGADTVAWGKEHDTIQLVNPKEEVVDTYSY